MNNNILKRGDFVNEVYIPKLLEQYENNPESLDEGLLSNLFGMVKNLFKKDWESIKGDPSIIAAYKEIDDSLTGFTTMKLAKKDVCNKIRQSLVNFAGDWYDYKKEQAKDHDEDDPKEATTYNFKDSTLREQLDKCTKDIKKYADGDEQMTKWAQTLLDDMKYVINQSLLNEIEDEKLKKKIEQELKDEAKKREEINKQAEEIQKKLLDQISNERKTLISNASATPLDEKLTPDKAIKEIAGEFGKYIGVLENNSIYKYSFDNIINEAKNIDPKINDLFKNDSKLGFKKIFEEELKKGIKDTKPFQATYAILKDFYTKLAAADVIDQFKEANTPAQSLQAMCISINAFVKICLYKETYNPNDAKDFLPLMAKCAITSNELLSYSLPLSTKQKGINYFVEITEIISNGEIGGIKGNNKFKTKKFDYTKRLKDNADKLRQDIVDEAKKMLEEGEKEIEKETSKFKSSTDKRDDSMPPAIDEA